MSMDDILLEAEEKMEKSYNRVHDDFQGVRTGKASPQLVDSLRVDCYGTAMRLKELAGITTPEPRMIMIQPWDISNVDPIRKAIEESKLGVNPIIDGKIIRLPLPELSEERRRDLIKVIKKISEDGKVAVRHNRRDGLEQIKKIQKAGDITEDDMDSGEKEIQKLHDTYIAKIDAILAQKESELLKV